MKLSYLVKKYQILTTSTQRPTLPHGITNYALSWRARTIAIACNFAKTYKKINHQHQHSPNDTSAI